MTIDDVRTALQGAGLSPGKTNAGKVRGLLGRGSNETIQRHLSALRTEVATLPELPPQPARQLDPPRAVKRDYQAARAARMHYLALDAQRAYDQARGHLVERAVVEADAARIASVLRQTLEALPAQLAIQLAGVDEAACLAILRARIHDALETAATALAPESRPARPVTPSVVPPAKAPAKRPRAKN